MSSKESTIIFCDLNKKLHVVHGPLSEEEQRRLDEWTEADKKSCFQKKEPEPLKPLNLNLFVTVNIVSRDPHEWDAIL